MTDEQAVIDAIHRLPDNASFDEIAEELQIMAAIRLRPGRCRCGMYQDTS
jgi:hypothetical protein